MMAMNSNSPNRKELTPRFLLAPSEVDSGDV